MNTKTHIGILLFLCLSLWQCQPRIESAPQRTYRFNLIPHRSNIQLKFTEGMDYSGLSQISLPNWEGCSGEFKRGVFSDCTRRNFEAFIQERFEIPQGALDSLVEGRIVYKFLVDDEGQIQSGEITQNPGGGLGEEMARTLTSAPLLEPASINSGEPVVAEINLAVYCDLVLRR